MAGRRAASSFRPRARADRRDTADPAVRGGERRPSHKGEPSMPSGPLAGLRVIDLTDDTGRFAAKMLAETGASVAQVVPAAPFAGPPMREPAAAARGGLLDWWYDG